MRGLLIRSATSNVAPPYHDFRRGAIPAWHAACHQWHEDTQDRRVSDNPGNNHTPSSFDVTSMRI